ncbi:GNAT family N-acetyltransferase [Streptococcus thoraltensis]|uniref:GNAT family N-acetyltransferase n=1 Tax=Streptococcus thoraltensis TaxID=55085 RepID=UPI0003767A14|nr:GNAT family N-acetyltransferase [Streptococcus thoraltensis]MDY4761120.1 GNAT family N-acetyltransferase [Streptococcus thoraltensis]
MWQLKSFEQLNTQELFQIYKTRVDIFVVEQTCAYSEIDEQDKIALHLFQMDDLGQIKAYCRLIPDQNIIKLGRVLVAKRHRKQKLGRALVAEAIKVCHSRFPNKNLFAQAQTHLCPFYQSFGFEKISDSYLEDDIPHTDMLLKLKEK